MCLVEMAVTEASLRSLLRNLSHFMSLLLSQKMDYAVSITAFINKIIRNHHPLAKVSDYLLLVEMAVTEASLRSLLRNLSHFLSLLLSQKMDHAVSITAFINKIIRNHHTFAKVSDYLLLVEMAVIETASENSFPQLSTSVADNLNLSFCTPVGRLTIGQLRYA